MKIKIKKSKFYESKFLQLDSNKSKNELSYIQVWNLKMSIEKTLNWYLSFIKKSSTDELCLMDIRNFEDYFKKYLFCMFKSNFNVI